MAYRSQEIYSQAARSLFMAVIHQAITDVLEDAEAAEAARQWLSSRDCESLLEVCGCDPDVSHAPQQQAAIWVS